MTDDKSLTLGILLAHLILPPGRAKNQNGEHKLKTRIRTVATEVARNNKEKGYKNDISLLDLGLAAFNDHASMLKGTKTALNSVKSGIATFWETSAGVKTLDQLMDAAKYFYELPKASAPETMKALLLKYPGTFSADGYDSVYDPEERKEPEPPKELDLPPTCCDLLAKTGVGKATVIMLDNGQEILAMLNKYRNWADLRIAISKRFDLPVSDIKFGSPNVPPVQILEPAKEDFDGDEVAEVAVACDLMECLQAKKQELVKQAKAALDDNEFDVHHDIVSKLKALIYDIDVVERVKKGWMDEDAGAEADAS